MKDALGHGSDPHGLKAAHQTGVRAATGKVRVERHVAYFGRTAAGQIKTNTGNVWQKITKQPKRRAVAESIARYQRIDHPNSMVRIR